MAKRQDLVDLVALSEKLAQNLEKAGAASQTIHTGLAGASAAAGNTVGTGSMSNPGGGANGTVATPRTTSTAGAAGQVLGTVLKGLGSVAGVGISAAANMLPSPAEAASYQLSTSRQGFFGGMSFGQTGNLQKAISAGGTALNSQDAVQAIAALQSAGIYNVNQVGGGVASLSNYAPNLGLAGTAQASASLYQGRSTNLLNQIGVKTMTAAGLARSPDQIANDFVDKIFATTPPLQKGSVEAYAYLQGALTPSGQLTFILNTYIPDQNLQQIIITKLFAKAKGLPDDATKAQLTAAGITTATVGAQSAYNTAQLGVTQATQASINVGTVAALKTLTVAANDFAKVAKDLGPELKAYGFGSTLMGGIGTTASAGLGGLLGHFLSGTGGAIFKALKGFFTNPVVEDAETTVEGLATGGPAKGNVPYIVGEKGPELFVPDSSGTIIPNHLIARANGGPVDQGGFASMLLGALGAPATQQNVADLTMWENMEGGNWNNTATYNPLNTSYQLNGSVNYNTRKAGSGVQAYSSWQQGLAATVATLTGANAGSRGYTNIVSALRAGASSQGDFLKLLQASSWDAGHYSGGASTSVADSSAGGMYSTSSVGLYGTIGNTAPLGTLLSTTPASTGAPQININVTVPSGTDPHAAAKTAATIQAAVKKALAQAGVTSK